MAFLSLTSSIDSPPATGEPDDTILPEQAAPGKLNLEGRPEQKQSRAELIGAAF
jgi:hypothetical protein